MAAPPPLVLFPSGEAAPSAAAVGESVGHFRSRTAEAMGVPAGCVEFVAGDGLLTDEQSVDDLAHLGITVVHVVVDAAARVKTFEDLGLKEAVLRGVQSYGFEKPTLMQALAIWKMMEGRSAIVQAPSGTGKTASYVISALERMDMGMAATQTLVLAPTRELACPIQKVAATIGEHMRLKSHACIGGINYRDSILALRGGPQFVVGTPGRVQDHIARRHLCLEDLKMFVLDEVDEMMSRGFKGLIFETTEMLPPEVQFAVFSATMPPELLDYLKTYLRNPVHLMAKKEELTLEGIRQFYIAIEKEEWKLDTLCDLLKMLPTTTSVIVFCNTRRKVDFLSRRMVELGHTILTMHAELDQTERVRVIREFNAGSILVSTDLLSGGNVQHGEVVINYDLPGNMENYLHRLGRSRYSKCRHVAISLVTDNDVRTLKDLERYYHTQIEEMPVDLADLI